MATYRPPHLRGKNPDTLVVSKGGELANPSLRTGDAQRAEVAIAENRRVYVGNMPYFAKEADIQSFFRGFLMEHVSISIDPFTGRNPSYAFVDLTTSTDAQQAIAELDGRKMLGRPIKVKPAVASRSMQGPSENGSSFQDFKEKSSVSRLPGRGRVWDRWQKPELEATAHFDLALTGRRVYVGNLPSFEMKPARVDAELKTFFRGFQIEAVSKIIPPHTSNLSNGHYVFVDFFTSDDASRAVSALNGTQSWGRAVKVSFAREKHSWKVEERDRYLATLKFSEI